MKAREICKQHKNIPCRDVELKMNDGSTVSLKWMGNGWNIVGRSNG